MPWKCLKKIWRTNRQPKKIVEGVNKYICCVGTDTTRYKHGNTATRGWIAGRAQGRRSKRRGWTMDNIKEGIQEKAARRSEKSEKKLTRPWFNGRKEWYTNQWMIAPYKSEL